MNPQTKPGTSGNRKHYIDNLRSLCILLLFPFHTAMIFVDFGEKWYLHSTLSRAATMLNMAVYPWWMSGLFVLAGISSVYSLKNRSGKEYAKTRTVKLLIPFLSSLILIVPVQTYIADIFYNNYSGNYLEHFKVFFTLTDFSGYDGHLTPGHTWFILFLFIISILTLPLLLWYKKKPKRLPAEKMTLPVLIPMFLLILLGSSILDIGGKSIVEFGICFLLGYFILSEDSVQTRLEKNAVPLGAAWVLLGLTRCIFYNLCTDGMITWPDSAQSLFGDLVRGLFCWIGILAMLGLGKRFLEFHTPLTQKFASMSFPVYLFHQSVIVTVGFGILKCTSNPVFQYISIALLSFAATMLLFWLCRQFRLTRLLFGIKK